MRLLECNSDEKFSVTKDFVGSKVPEYAILSHTWGSDTEEITFQDLKDGIGQDKTGYYKIRFCIQQARRDNLQYVWVDTCCIDKSNNTELSEAINSMFRWYRKAVKCYVYLSDVSRTKQSPNNQFCELSWESAFRSCKWFTRGWTLQELLAPRTVEFFSREGEWLGDKKTLEGQIHEITGIAVSALQTDSLSQFKVEERLSWSDNRETTRPEDKAYSLLGIFDVYMPLIYGEGRGNAFRRLREEINRYSKTFDHLPFAAEALFNSYSKQYTPVCLPDTRVALLEEIHNWIDGQDKRCIFWLNGLAGTGKSTIAHTVAQAYHMKGQLAAGFFFSRGGGDAGNASKFVTTIATQLVEHISPIRPYIFDAITEYPTITGQSLIDQWRQLIIRPLSKLDGTNTCIPYILVIDALDECESENDTRIILQLLPQIGMFKSVQFRVFLTSRPETPIRHSFHQLPETEHKDFVLHNISPSIANHDIRIFLRHNLNLIAGERSLGTGWPGEQVINRLVHNASGLFIWAATTCRFIREGRRFATRRLDMILESSIASINAPEKHLDEVYLTVLRHSISQDYMTEEAEALCYMLKSLLGSIVVLYSPLSIPSLSQLLKIAQEELDEILNDVHAILDIPADETNPVRLHHPSFRDFLLDKRRCGNSNFNVDEQQANQTLVECCIELMSKSLKPNICGQQAPGTLVTDMESSHIEQFLSPAVKYACLYWVQHLQKSGGQLRDQDLVYEFLQTHLLHWFEALGWMGKTSEGILAIYSLEALVRSNTNLRLYALVYDAKRFILYNRLVIEQAPLQLYSSALVFAPQNSLVKRQFQKYIPSWVQKTTSVQLDWSAALQTLEGHSSVLTSLAFSPDGGKIASGSVDNTVRLWDAATGTTLQILGSHLELRPRLDRTPRKAYGVSSVAFSPDGKQIISGSSDLTVRLWDAVTGAMMLTFEGHSGWVNSVAFSPDGKQIVSGSSDTTVRLWHAARGETIKILEGHSDWVNSVAFSPDGKQIASGSNNQTVWLWDVVTGAKLQTLTGHLSRVNSVAFSPDGNQIVSGSNDMTLRLWDTAKGETIKILAGHSDWVNSVAFSPSGKKIVSGSSDKTVRLWDAVTGLILQKFEVYIEIYSVAFSPDGKQLVSGSDDATVRLWDATASATLQTLESHSSRVAALAFSIDGKKVVSGSESGNIQLWDATTGVISLTFKNSNSMISSVAFSPDCKQLVSGTVNGEVQFWDVSPEIMPHILKGHSDWVSLVAFSPDGKYLMSKSDDRTVQLWNAVTRTMLKPFKDYLNKISSVGFSTDDQQVVLGLDDGTVQLWDPVTGIILRALTGHSGRITAIAFSPNRKQVVSGSIDGTVRIWDTVSGTALQALENYQGQVTSLAFSPDGRQAVLKWDDGTVQLSDAATGTILQTFKRYKVRATSVSFSANGKIRQGPFVSDEWIVKGNQNTLWLPPDYRATCFDVWSESIAIGHLSGKVSVLRFK